MDRQSKANELMQKGFECLDEYNLKGAHKVGNQLIKMKYSGGYEIVAKAYYVDGKLRKAIKCLEQGVKQNDRSWIVWQLLGIYYNDAKEYQKAHEAFDSALQRDNCDIDLVSFNKCITYESEGKVHEAIRHCEALLRKDIDDKQLEIHARNYLIGLLNEIGDWSKTIELGKTLVQDICNFNEDMYDQEQHAIALSIMSYALFRSGSFETAREYLSEAFKIGNCPSEALFALREMDNRKSLNSKYFRIVVHGKFENMIVNDEIRDICFFSTCDVIADDIKEALDFLKVVFPPKCADTLTVDESELIEDKPNEYKGVYRFTGYSMCDCEE